MYIVRLNFSFAYQKFLINQGNTVPLLLLVSTTDVSEEGSEKIVTNDQSIERQADFIPLFDGLYRTAYKHRRDSKIHKLHTMLKPILDNVIDMARKKGYSIIISQILWLWSRRLVALSRHRCEDMSGKKDSQSEERYERFPSFWEDVIMLHSNTLRVQRDIKARWLEVKKQASSVAIVIGCLKVVFGKSIWNK